MDNLLTEEKSIEALNKEIEELNKVIRQLKINIHDNQNKINEIIKRAIDNIVENKFDLIAFKKESEEQILEIIKKKKDSIKIEKDIKTKKDESFEKIKQYILSYIKNKKIAANKVIYYYNQDISGSQFSHQSLYTYIYYISIDDKIYRYTTNNEISDNGDINVKTKTDVSETDLNKIYGSIQSNDIKDIENYINNINIST